MVAVLRWGLEGGVTCFESGGGRRFAVGFGGGKEGGWFFRAGAFTRRNARGSSFALALVCPPSKIDNVSVRCVFVRTRVLLRVVCVCGASSCVRCVFVCAGRVRSACVHWCAVAGGARVRCVCARALVRAWCARAAPAVYRVCVHVYPDMRARVCACARVCVCACVCVRACAVAGAGVHTCSPRTRSTRTQPETNPTFSVHPDPTRLSHVIRTPTPPPPLTSSRPSSAPCSACTTCTAPPPAPPPCSSWSAR